MWLLEDETEGITTKTDRPLSTYNWIKEGVLCLSKKDLKEIKENYSRKEINFYVCRLIREHNMGFPYKEFSPTEAKSTFSLLKQTDCSPILNDWEFNIRKNNNIDYSSFDLKLLGKNVYFKPFPGFNIISDIFVHRVRLGASNFAKKSTDKLWEDIRTTTYDELKGLPHLVNQFVTGMVHFSEEGLLMQKSVYDAARLNAYLPSQFNVSIAKGIYDFFQAKNVLDFCGGWGDRLAGFLASDAYSYVGIDPNSKLHTPYQQIADFYGTGKRVGFICSPAEDVDYTNLEYDFAFTSPPYFNLEIYSDESTQSVSRYKKFDAWLELFLFKTLKLVYEGLSEGGRLAVNIADFNKVQICKPMFKFMEDLGATYEGAFGYGLYSYRPNKSENARKGVQPAEPVFVWSKGVAPEPKWKQDNFFGV